MRALIVAGVLGTGTAVVFAVAALTATMFPNGTVVSSSWNGGGWVKQGFGGVAVPVPAPAIEVAPFVVDDGSRDGFTVPNQGFQPLPGDVVTPVEGQTQDVAPAP
jgi:hypothetical protein